ncbi:MAG: type II toxin-antitoxin system RelE/ParE family toxin [Amaricoccus sp.]
MRVVFSRRSVARLREIPSWIAYDNVTAAAQVVSRIRQCAELLSDHPKLGTVWRDGPTRALVVSGLPYRIHYRLDEAFGVVQIITVAHTSRRPPSFE